MFLHLSDQLFVEKKKKRTKRKRRVSRSELVRQVNGGAILPLTDSCLIRGSVAEKHTERTQCVFSLIGDKHNH